ncbi:MAG: patatin-like phospholipase family protein [Janthinobacterium lividum]
MLHFVISLAGGLRLSRNGDPLGNRALVLGSGGVTGIAWMTGLLFGLQERGADLLTADRILGTSAGAAVGAQITSGVPLAELFRYQTDPALQVPELEPTAEQFNTVSHTLPSLMHIENEAERLHAIGMLAMNADTIEEQVRRSSIAERLPSHKWPERPLEVVAVDVRSGEVQIFTCNAGVDLVDAVAASCAVPGLWPAVTVSEHRYMDGSIRSSDNTDLALDCSSLVVISPLGEKTGHLPGGGLPAQVCQRDQAGLRTFVIEPDQAVHEAIGTDPFDIERRTPTAEAGRVQGRALASEVAAFWSRLSA